MHTKIINFQEPGDRLFLRIGFPVFQRGLCLLEQLTTPEEGFLTLLLPLGFKYQGSSKPVI
jgi:hypothetical protein